MMCICKEQLNVLANNPNINSLRALYCIDKRGKKENNTRTPEMLLSTYTLALVYRVTVINYSFVGEEIKPIRWSSLEVVEGLERAEM